MEYSFLESFQFSTLLGRGKCGKVWKAVYVPTNFQFAVKEISKFLMFQSASQHLDQNERKILPLLFSPFIVNLHLAFQSPLNLYLVLDYMPGGNFRKYLNNGLRIDENECKFIIANVVVGLEYIHGKKIIHHDIKPENLVFDDKGYVRITDFGLSQKYKEGMVAKSAGTNWYLAPEVLFGQAYTYSADYFSLGIIMYEIMEEGRPFNFENREQLKNFYVNEKIVIRNLKNWSSEAVEFLQGLLVKYSNKRTGYDQKEKIKEHLWFKGFDWEAIYSKSMKSPCFEKLFRENEHDLSYQRSSSIIQEQCDYVKGFFYVRNKKYLSLHH